LDSFWRFWVSRIHPRRVHLEQLQKLLAAGAEDPVAAMERVRRHTGYELATVLRQIGGEGREATPKRP